MAEKLVANLASLGLALSAATTPESGKKGFDLEEDEIEFGIGIHGEPGYRKEKLHTSKEMMEEFYEKIKKELALDAETEIVVLVNGMGATPLMEQYVFANDVLEKLKEDNIKVAKTMVGDYMTAIDMAGISLTVLKVEDPKWVEYLNQEVHTIAW